jgi:hypothetical protein
MERSPQKVIFATKTKKEIPDAASGNKPRADQF